MNRLACIGILAGLCGLAADAWGAEAKYKVEEQKLGEAPPEGFHQEWTTEEESHCAWTVADKATKKTAVVVDGARGPWYDTVRPIGFSPEGGRFAYVAIKGKRHVVVSGGKEGPEFDFVDDDSVAMSRDGSRLACAAREGKTWRLVLDGKPAGEYDYVGRIGLSADGKQVAYFARSGERDFVAVGGKTIPTSGDASLFTFGPDGRLLAYKVEDDDTLDDYVVVDGEAGPKFQNVWEIRSSPDGRRVAYRVADVSKEGATQWRVVLDGKPGPLFDQVDGLAFSPDSKRAVYVGVKDKESKDRKYVLMVNNEPAAEHDVIFSLFGLAFSPDGSRLGYAAQQGGKQFVVVEGKPGSTFDLVWFLAFSGDGRHFAHVARRGEQWLAVLDGQPVVTSAAQVYNTTLNHDGTRLAYVTGQQFGGAFRVVVDGQPGPSCRRVLKPTFRNGGAVEYLAAKDGSLYRVRHVPVE